MLKVAIVGGTGYTGAELVRLLAGHPKANVVALTSRSEAGRPLSALFGNLRGVSDLAFCEPSLEALSACDVVFFATPHGVCMQMAQSLLAQGIKVIDLGADFRLKDTDAFLRYYDMQHSCPDVLAQAVYGLPEINRHAIKTASLVANPGCYPTTAILGLKPVMMHAQHIEPYVVIDAKSGVSGAGRQAKLELLYGQIAENFSAYGVASHRHQPEIEQGLRQLAGEHMPEIRFVPHLVPMFRGMFSTIHLRLSASGEKMDWQSVFEVCYQNEPFVRVLPKGILPATQTVRTSNFLNIGIHQDGKTLTIMVVQDNLVKGAAGQAIQNMNLMAGLDETLGLLSVPV